MAQIAYNFCQNGICNGFAVGDDAVEAKNQCGHYFNSGRRV
jgi:hypothetical protein